MARFLTYIFWILLLVGTLFLFTSDVPDPVLFIKYFSYALFSLFPSLILLFQKKINVDKSLLAAGSIITVFLVWQLFLLPGTVNMPEALHEIAKTALFLILFSTFGLLFLNTEFKQPVLLSLFLAWLFVLGYGLVQGVWMQYIGEGSFTEIVSFLGNPNIFCSVLGLLTFPAVQFLISRFSKKNAVVFLPFFVTFVTLLTVYSKSSILAFLVSVSVYLLFTNYHLIKNKFYGLKVIFRWGIVVLIVLSIVVAGSLFMSNNYIRQVLATEKAEPGKLDGNSERILLWKNTVKLIADNPLTGVGPGNWKLRFHEYGGVRGWYLENGRLHFIIPHNDWLQLIAENGFPGALIIFSFLSFIVFYTVKKAHATGDFVVNGLTIGTIVFLLSDGFFSYPWDRPEVLMIVAVVGAYSFAAPLSNEHSCVIPISKKNRYALSVCFLLLSVLVSMFFYHRYQSDVWAAKAELCRQKLQAGPVLKYTAHISPAFYSMDRNMVPFRYNEGLAYLRSGDTLNAVTSFKLGQKQNPNHLFLLNAAAVTLYATGDTLTAINNLKRCLDISPGFAQARYFLAVMYLHAGNTSEAFKTYSYNQLSKPDELMLGIVQQMVFDIIDSGKFTEEETDKMELLAQDRNILSELYQVYISQDADFVKALLDYTK